MSNKKLFFGIFVLIILMVPAIIIFNSERVLENGHRHKLHLRGYDPFDPFRGKYLRLNYENTIPCDLGLKTGDKAFVLLEKEKDGFSHFSKAKKTKPEGGDFIVCEIENVYDGMATVKIDNLNKYFINEDKAEKAEMIIQKFTRNQTNELYVAIRVLDGDVRLEDIFVQDESIGHSMK